MTQIHRKHSLYRGYALVENARFHTEWGPSLYHLKFNGFAKLHDFANDVIGTAAVL